MIKIIMTFILLSISGAVFAHSGSGDIESLKNIISEQVKEVPCDYVNSLLDGLLIEAPSLDKDIVEEHDISADQQIMMKEIRAHQITELQMQQILCVSKRDD